MAKRLLGFADSAESEAIALAATKDALDKSGLAAKNAVSVEVGITKPWEGVFEGISEIVAGPRDPEATSAELPELDTATESDDAAEMIGEIDDDEIEDGLLRIQRERERESADVIDVEIVDAGYTDAPMTSSPAPLTPDDPDHSLSGTLSPSHPGSGLMSLSDAVAVQREMQRRANLRNAQRR